MNSPHDFSVASSETLHVGRVMALRCDRVVMPGEATAAREVVEHSGAVAVVPLDDEQRVVMIHQYRHAIGRRLWELPAGLLDEPGEDPLDTARRELVEETGLVAADWALLVDIVASPGFTDESVRVFLARELSEVGRPDGADEEEADLTVERVPLVQAVRQVLAGEIVNSSTVAGLLAAHAVLTGGQPRADASTLHAGLSADASTLQAGLSADASTLQAGLSADASTLQAGLRPLHAPWPDRPRRFAARRQR